MDEARYATVVWLISVTLHGRIEASQDSRTEDGRMTRTVVRSTVVRALALLTGAPAGAAPLATRRPWRRP
jgi:hypothetical protein